MLFFVILEVDVPASPSDDSGTASGTSNTNSAESSKELPPLQMPSNFGDHVEATNSAPVSPSVGYVLFANSLSYTFWDHSISATLEGYRGCLRHLLQIVMYILRGRLVKNYLLRNEKRSFYISHKFTVVRQNN